jgi:hypothetical protein
VREIRASISISIGSATYEVDTALEGGANHLSRELSGKGIDNARTVGATRNVVLSVFREEGALQLFRSREPHSILEIPHSDLQPFGRGIQAEHGRE